MLTLTLKSIKKLISLGHNNSILQRQTFFQYQILAHEKKNPLLVMNPGINLYGPVSIIILLSLKTLLLCIHRHFCILKKGYENQRKIAILRNINTAHDQEKQEV